MVGGKSRSHGDRDTELRIDSLARSIQLRGFWFIVSAWLKVNWKSCTVTHLYIPYIVEHVSVSADTA